MLLTKGIEIEQYTGLITGQVLPLSAMVSQNLEGFAVEPDQRNVEYITPICTSYEDLSIALIKPRMQLRRFLTQQNQDWTVVPSSSLALPFENNFIFSKPDNPYHKHIQEKHGVQIITTSAHYNVGISDPNQLIRLVDLIRLEAPLLLALSAASPFYDGQNTGSQSYRWQSFPKVPQIIPFFGNPENFANWTEQMLEEGQIYNVRHFWGAVRPNGPSRPHDLNRLEIRICDLNTSWETILAIMAWIEARVHYFLKNETETISTNDHSLITLSDENEIMAAQRGLSGHFSDWVEGAESTIYEAIEKRWPETHQIANKLGIAKYLQPIQQILTEGNEAVNKASLLETQSLDEIMQNWTQESLEADLCFERKCAELESL